MPWDQIFTVGRWVFVSDETGWWKYVRMVVLIGFICFSLWLWLLKFTIEPTQHAMRQSFGVIKFDYFDGYEDDPTSRPKWYNVKNDAELQAWKATKLAQWTNRRDAKALRNSPDGNKPHELLKFGKPRIYGPGWYTSGPRQKGVTFIPLDTRNRVVDITLYVKQDGGFEVFVLPIQLTIRIANLYLWMQACNNTEGQIMGDIRTKSWSILDLGYETIRKDAKQVAQVLIDSIREDAQNEGSVAWCGGEAIFVKPSPPEYQPVSLVAEAMRHRSSDGSISAEDGRALRDLEMSGAAVTVSMAIQKDSNVSSVDTAA